MSTLPPDVAEDQSTKAIVTAAIFASLATVTVVLRFIARSMKRLPLLADDWFILAALVIIWVLTGLTIAAKQYGLGRHIEALSKEDVMMFFKLLYVFQVFYCIGPATTKLSILFLYKRVFVGSRFTLAVHILLAFVAIWGTTMVFMAIFNCRPVDAFWTQQGTCIDFRTFALVYAVINIITDFVVWILPLPLIWRLHLGLGQRVALSLIFLFGLFACASAMARLISSMLVLGSPDPTWDYTAGFWWSVIEPSVGVMCSCLPTCRVVFTAMLPDRWRQAFRSQQDTDMKRSQELDSKPLTQRSHATMGHRLDSIHNTGARGSFGDHTPPGAVEGGNIGIQYTRNFEVREERDPYY